MSEVLNKNIQHPIVGADPEILSSGEVHIPRNYNVVLMPIDIINVCSQHRNGSNSIQQELDRSVGNRDLMHPLTATILDRTQTEAYVDFTNNVWQTDVEIDNFTPCPGTDEFVVLVAGHSRLKSLRSIADAKGAHQGTFFEHVRILDDAFTPDEIIGWQTEENIHESPPPQNTAKLLVEAWQLLKKQEQNGGPRISQKEFARRHNVGEKTLRNALNYAKLPPSIRGLVDDKLLHFSVGVELGRAFDVVSTWADKIDPENSEELAKTEIYRLAIPYLDTGKVLMSQQIIRSKVNSMQEVIDGGPSVQPPLEDFMRLVVEPTPLEKARTGLEGELRQIRERIQRGQVGLHNAIAKLSGFEDAVVDEELQHELVSDAEAALGIMALRAA